MNLHAQEEYGEFLDNAIEAAAKYDVENYNINLKYFVTALEKDKVTPETLPEIFYNKYLQCIFASQLYEIEMPEEFRESIYQFAKYGADNRNPDAMYILARAYFDGTGITKNEEQALFWLKEAGESGSAEAMHLLSSFYQYGVHFAQNEETAESWNKKSLETLLNRAKQENQKNDLTLLGISSIYYDKKNFEQAQIWAKKSAEQGNVKAMVQLGFLLQKSDEEKGIEWLEKACDTGYKTGCTMYESWVLSFIASHYSVPSEGKPDYAKKKEWYERLIERGSVTAMYLLGINYQLEQDFAKAKEWYKKACEAGNEDSCQSYEALK